MTGRDVRPLADAGRSCSYLCPLAVGAVAVLALSYLVVGVSWARFSPGDLVALASVVTALALWLRTRPGRSLDGGQRVFLWASLATWVWVGVLTTVRQGYAEPAWLLVLALAALALSKPPRRREVVTALDLLLGGVVVVSALALLLEVLGVKESWYLGGDLLAAWERQHYWMPLADPLSLDGRWAGPFDHPGRTGQVAALILVWGLARGGVRGWVLAGSGAVMVLLAASSTAYLAAGAGIGILLAVLGVRRLRASGRWARLPRWLPVAVIGAGLLALLVVIVAPNSSLSGRTSVWPTYVDLWRASPWWGTGTDGITQALRSGLLPRWAYHAHDTWLDLLARHGIPALVGAVLAMAGALWSSGRAALRGAAAAFALIAVAGVASITQPILGWLAPTIPLTTVMLAVLLSEDRADEPVEGTGAVAQV